MLSIENLLKIYEEDIKRVKTIKNISEVMEEKEFVLPSGHKDRGKTTLFECITRILKPTK